MNDIRGTVQIENRESFFHRIENLYPTRDVRYKTIEKAYSVAKDAERYYFREDGVTRKFEHDRAVALIILDELQVDDHEVIAAALIHDLPEDHPFWSCDRVELFLVL